MRLFDRDRIWGLAWVVVPIALLINVFVGADYEVSMRLAYQAATDAGAGDWPKALGSYERAAEAAPNSAAMAHNVSVAYHTLGDAASAMAWNDEALAREPDFAPALEARPTLQRDLAIERRRAEQ